MILDAIKNSEFIVSFATCFKDESQMEVLNTLKNSNAKFLFMHPIDNYELKSVYSQFIKYEVGSEEGIVTMLLNTFVKSSTKDIQGFIDDLDLGYISAESSAGEEEFEDAYELSKDCKNKTLIVGNDISNHSSLENIIKILKVIKKYSDFNLVVLDKKIENLINEIEDENLEEVEELDSYNGTISYFVSNNELLNNMYASSSFTKIAKVNDNDEVYVCFDNQELKRTIKIDKNLSGTIAITNNENSVDGYRFKQVKIKKVNA